MALNSLIGQQLGRYQIRALLGRGGMASVYRAHDTVLGRDVALKVLYPHFTGDQASVERFLQEARTVARLDHPNIVPIYDVVQQDGLVYIAMKLLEGQSLQELLTSGRPLSLRQALALATQIAQALDYAHARGIVHRDIKPANIFIERVPTGDGGSTPRTLLTDFGIAKSLDAPGVTSTGMMIGTPDYMAPEQIRGPDVDGRADVYALGILLYRALTAQQPFHGSVQEVLMAQLTQLPSPPSQLNPSLGPAVDSVILRALAKQPDQRFPSAGALVSALTQAARNPQAVAGPDQQPTLVAQEPPRPQAGAAQTPRPLPTPAQVATVPPTVADWPDQAARPATGYAPQAAEPSSGRQSFLLPGILLAIVAALALALIGVTSGLFGQTGSAAVPTATTDPLVGALPSPTPTETLAPTVEPTQDPLAGVTATVPATPTTTATVEPTPPPTTSPQIVTVVVTTVPPTATPTSRPESPSATPTNPPEPPTATPTDTPEPPTATPTPTEDPLAACDQDLFSGGFGMLWNGEPTVREALGCPTDREVGSTNVSQRDFERGAMIWWGQAREIYVLVGAPTGGEWSLHPDTYEEGEALPEQPTPTSSDLYVPGRGFGKLWINSTTIRDAVGYSTEPVEEGPIPGALQNFERGRMIYLDEPDAGKVIFVLLNGGQFTRYRDPAS